MTWRRGENRLHTLMLSRRNIFVALPHSARYDYAIVGATGKIISVHLGFWRGSFSACESRYFGADPSLWDGYGWSLSHLNTFLNEIGYTSAPDQIGGISLQTIDLDNYKSFGSFCAVYTERKRELLSHPDAIFGRQALCVLDAVAQHANPLGLLYAGVKRIMDVSHYGRGTVQRCLDHLFERDWIRHVVIERPELGETDHRWQISPFVLWVSHDYIEAAIALWDTASNIPNKDANVICNEMCKTQPESLTRIPSRIPTNHPTRIPSTTTTTNSAVKQHQTHARADAHTPMRAWEPETPSPDLLDMESSDHVDSDPDHPDRNPAHSANHQREAQNKKLPPSSAPPPLKHPLADPQAEGLAHTLQARLNTRLPQSRQLVAAHGVDLVESGLAWVEYEQRQGRAKNPFGLLKWWLENGAVAGKPQEEQRRATGWKELGND